MRTRTLIRFGLMLTCASLPLSACSTKTGTGAAIGGIGAALLTGSATSAAIGAAAGAGIGYLSEQEQARQREEARKEQEALQKAQITSNPSTAYRPTNANPFTGSTWRVISMEGRQTISEYSQIVVSFQTNTKVTTMYSKRDGESDAYVETYGVVDDVIVFRGVEDGKDYSVAAKFTKNNNLLSLTFEDLKVILEEVEENV